MIGAAGMKNTPALATAWQNGQLAGSRSVGVCAGACFVVLAIWIDPPGETAPWIWVWVMKDCSVKANSTTHARARHDVSLRRNADIPAVTARCIEVQPAFLNAQYTGTGTNTITASLAIFVGRKIAQLWWDDWSVVVPEITVLWRPRKHRVNASF